MRKQVDKAQGALPCFLVSLVSLFPCLLIYLSTNKNAPPPAYCQGRGVKPRGTTLLEPENRPRSVAVGFTDHSTPDNGGASGANYYVSRFTFHVSRFARPTPRPIRRRRGCLVHTLGGSLKPGSPLLARFTVVRISIGESMPQPSEAVKQTGLKPGIPNVAGHSVD